MYQQNTSLSEKNHFFLSLFQTKTGLPPLITGTLTLEAVIQDTPQNAIFKHKDRNFSERGHAPLHEPCTQREGTP